MIDQQIKLECLRLANGNPNIPADKVVALAEHFHAFATGDPAGAKLEAVRAAIR